MKKSVQNLKQLVPTMGVAKTFLVLLLFSVINWTYSQTTTYSASSTSWSIPPTGNVICSGTLLGNIIKHRVSISNETAIFEVSKESGTFSSAGTVYIKDAYCGNILKQVSFTKGVSYITIPVNLSHTLGSRSYVATLNSNSGEKFYTNPLTITATTQSVTNLTASPTSLNFTSNGGTQSIEVNSNATWTVSAAPAGFSISVVNPNKINVVASSNEKSNATTQSRGGSFNIIAGSGANAKTLSIALNQAGKVVTPVSDFKIIGYLPTYQWGIANQVNYLKMLTHINLAFIKPKTVWSSVRNQWEVDFDNQGNVILEFEEGKTDAQIVNLMNNLSQITSSITGKKLVISVAIAGADNSEKMLNTYKYLFTSKQLRSALTNGIINFVNRYGLDGVDIDLEYNAMKLENYNTYVQEASNIIRSKGKLITAAVEVKNNMYSFIHETTINNLDWINQMSYDESQDQHAPMSTFVSDFKVWNNPTKSGGKNISASKIVMGLPFYGRLSTSQRKISNPEIPYFDIFNSNSSNKSSDYAKNVKNSWLNVIHSDVLYNGTNTISSKTKLSISNKCGGVMIWSLGSDKYDDINNSLLKVIYDTALSGSHTNSFDNTVNQFDVSAFYAYPNPAIDWVYFNKEVSYQIIDENSGLVVMSSEEYVKSCNVSKLPSGRYIIRTNRDEFFRLIK